MVDRHFPLRARVGRLRCPGSQVQNQGKCGQCPHMDNQPNNPLHGVTLETMLTELVAHHGWDGLAERIHIRCFVIDPSIKSSLSFLRKTPWARDKVETAYRFMLNNRRKR
jgi:uncharacterized protein (DUF2132 family)